MNRAEEASTMDANELALVAGGVSNKDGCYSLRELYEWSDRMSISNGYTDVQADDFANRVFFREVNRGCYYNGQLDYVPTRGQIDPDAFATEGFETTNPFF